MQTRQVGRTKLRVTEYSFGTAGLGGLYRTVPREAAMATIEAAWDAGMRFFDTAPHYGLGLAERRLGDFLQGKERSSFAISTKVGRLLVPTTDTTNPRYGFVDPLPFDEIYDYSGDGIKRSVEFSLARLGLNSIDILYVHDIGKYTHGAAKNDFHFRQLMDSGIRALEDLKASGAISGYGLGVNEVPICLDVMKGADLDCILLAGRYSLLDRSGVAELLPLCKTRGTSIVAGGVFNSGILATGAVPGAHFDYEPASADVLARVGKMEALAKEAGVPLSAAAMQFPLQSDVVASVLIGTAKPESLVRNMKDAAVTVPASFYVAVEDLTLVQPALGDEPVRV